MFYDYQQYCPNCGVMCFVSAGRDEMRCLNCLKYYLRFIRFRDERIFEADGD
jgi:hypothetical protein